MREIKFRGKTKEGDWVYGGFGTKALNHNPCIIQENRNTYHGLTPIEVIPETVGQYTGLKDKNGVEIYEGDLVKQSGYWLNVVVYLGCKFMMKVNNHDKGVRYHNFFNGVESYGKIDKGVEVIGNIHDKN